jgi:hypothetical protein
MKLSEKNVMIAALTFLVMVACNRAEDTYVKSIEGTYIGSLSKDGLKNKSGVAIGDNSATAVVSRKGDGLVEVHCYGGELDTIFMLNYYEHNDSVMVCLTGDDFENTYGHMMGQGHMDGGMMGDISNEETEWMHHINDEHHNGDEHFGGFDMMNNTFWYRFKMMEGGSPYYMKFQGEKE